MSTALKNTMELNKKFKGCYVPECMSTSLNSPDKIFVTLPTDEEKRRQWLLAANISKEELFDLPKNLYFCEDHFQKSDFHNYMQYKAKMAAILLITQDAFPRDFSCQKSRTQVARNNLSTNPTSLTVKKTTAPNTIEREVSKEMSASPTELKQIEQHLQIYDNIVSKLFDKSDATYTDHIYFLQEFIVHVPIICTSITEMFVSKTFNQDQWYNYETANFMACASLSGKKVPAFLYKEPVIHGRLNRPDGVMKSCVLMAWLQHFAKFKSNGNVLLVLNSNARNLLRNPPPELSDQIKKLHISLYVTPQIGSLELNPVGLEIFNCFKKALEAIVTNHCKSASRLIAASETLLTKFTAIAWSKVGPEVLAMSFQKSGICTAGNKTVNTKQLYNAHQTEGIVTATMTSGASEATEELEATIKIEDEQIGIPAPDMQVPGRQNIATSVLRVVPAKGKSDGFEMVFLPKHPENEQSGQRNIFEDVIYLKEEPLISQDDVISESEAMLFPTLTQDLNLANISQQESFQEIDLHPISTVSAPSQSSSTASISNTQNINIGLHSIFSTIISHPLSTVSVPLQTSSITSVNSTQSLNLGNIAQPVTVQKLVSHPTAPVPLQSSTSTSNPQIAPKSGGNSKSVQQIIVKPSVGLTSKTLQQLKMKPFVALKKLPTTIQDSEQSIVSQALDSQPGVWNATESDVQSQQTPLPSNINVNHLLVPISESNTASPSTVVCSIPTISNYRMANVTSNLQPVPPLAVSLQNTSVSGNNNAFTTVRTLQKISAKTLPLILNKKRPFQPQSLIFDTTSLDSNCSNNTSFSWVSVRSVNDSNSTEARSMQQISSKKQARKQDPSVKANRNWFERFKPLSQAVHKTLTISCLVCDEVCSCPEALRLHLNAYHPQELYKCKHCLVKYNAKQIIFHILSEHKCRYCGVEATHMSVLTNHLKDIHNSNDQPSLYMSFGDIYHCSPVVTPTNKGKQLRAYYQCDGCGIFMNKVSLCKMHQQRGCVLVTCDWCKKEFFSLAHLSKHLLNTHLKRYYCSFKKCKHNYAFHQSLKLHQELYHSFPLDFRRKKGIKKKNPKPKRPKVSETGRPLRRVAAQNLALAKALRSVRELLTFRCDHCGVTKHSRSALKLHLWTRHLSHVSLECHCGKLSKIWKMHRMHLKQSYRCSIWT